MQIEVKKLKLGYEGKIIVDNVSFSVSKGNYICIIGENGTGKSTLLKALVNLHKPLDGRILLGEDFKLSDIGYLPQKRDIQSDFPASVNEIVLTGFLNATGLRPFYNMKERTAAGVVMEKLGIADISKRCYRELSGGQQQRVLLARALCSAKKMILLDEPVTGLDPNATNEMYRIIENLNKTENITIIMVSHAVASSLQYASHILKLNKDGSNSFEKIDKQASKEDVR